MVRVVDAPAFAVGLGGGVLKAVPRAILDPTAYRTKVTLSASTVPTGSTEELEVSE